MMTTSLWLPFVVVYLCLLLTEVDTLSCHVCESAIGKKDIDCEVAPNSPRTCMAMKDKYCQARAAFFGNILSSVVRACSETCEPDYDSCLRQHGECTLCCDTDNCNSRSAINVETFLATHGPSTISPPVTAHRNSAGVVTDSNKNATDSKIVQDDKNQANKCVINRKIIAVLIMCVIWISF